MAVIKAETFEGGTAGAAVSSSNSGATYVSGTPTFTTDAAVGTLAQSSITTTSGAPYSQFIFTGGVISKVFIRFYIKPINLGAAHYVCCLVNTATAKTTLRINAGGEFRLLGTTTQQIGPASLGAPLTASEWVRVEWMVDGTTQQLKTFRGANAHGTVPDFDSGAIAWEGSTFDRVHLGVVAAFANMNLVIDDLVADNSAWPGPAVAAPADPEPTVWRYTGTAWAQVTPTPIH